MARATSTPEPETVAPEPAEAAGPVPAWIRVRDRVSGHEVDIAGSAFDSAAYIRVNKPAQYPDLFGDLARPRPATFRTDLAGQPVENQESDR